MRALLLVLLLAACSANGPMYGQLKPNPGSIVVYRQTHFWGSGGYWEIDINGVPTCKINNGGFYIFETKDPVVISSSLFGMPGTSRIKITPSNKVQYVRIELNHGKQVAGVNFGFAGMLVAEGVADTGGPFIFTPMESSVAQRELAPLHQQENCL